MGRLFLFLAATATASIGCTWHTYDDDYPWDHTCDYEGRFGDSCYFDCECGDGLICDDYAEICAPEPQSSICSLHSDCDYGFYCEEATGSCLESNVCTEDDDCGDGFTCDEEIVTCVPEVAPPACSEIVDESSCVERPDCEPRYVGVDCSCGPDCECTGGEDGCICQSFEFDSCAVTSG